MLVRWALSALVVGVALVPRDAHASDIEIQAMAGPSVFASTWRGDVGLGATLRAGVRFAHVVSVDFQGWESYATVDKRLNTGLSLGVAGYLPLASAHPYVRAFVLHQHEEGVASAQHSPAGTLIGIGDGIRHRAGLGASLGVEIPFSRATPKRVSWLALAELTSTYFPDAELGPQAYVGIDLGIGMDFLLR